MTEIAAEAQQGPRKFMFDRSFDDELSNVVHARDRRPITLTQEQLDEIKKESHDAGLEAGKKAALDEQIFKINGAVEHIGKVIENLVSEAAANRHQQEVRVREAVLAIARKILPEFNQRHGLQEIEAIIAGVITEMNSEPRLVVRVNEAQFDAIDHSVKAITEKQGYAGKVVLLADAEVAANDCRVEWADGGVERNLQALWNNLGKSLTPGQELPPDSPPPAPVEAVPNVEAASPVAPETPAAVPEDTGTKE